MTSSESRNDGTPRAAEAQRDRVGLGSEDSSPAAPSDRGTSTTSTGRFSRLQVPFGAWALAAVALGLLVVIVVETLGSRADPAEVQEIADQYAESTNALAIPVSEEQAKCRAEVYLESNLSEAALDDVRAGRAPRPSDDRDSKILADLASQLAECL